MDGVDYPNDSKYSTAFTKVTAVCNIDGVC